MYPRRRSILIPSKLSDRAGRCCLNPPYPGPGGDMGPHSVREYAASLRGRYRLASRREKTRLLDEFCRVTTRHRKVAIGLLRHRPKRARRRGGRPRQYGRTLRPALEQVWEASDYLVLQALGAVSAGADRGLGAPRRGAALGRAAHRARADQSRDDRSPLGPVRRLHRRHGRATTSPSLAALRAQVPLRTFGEWARRGPGEPAGGFAGALRGEHARLLPHVAPGHRRRHRVDRTAGRVGQGPAARRQRGPLRPPRPADAVA